MSRTDQVLARTKRCRELVQSGMPLAEALKEAHINRDTYIRGTCPCCRRCPHVS